MYLFVPNKMLEPRVADRLAKAFQFAFFAFSNQLDPAIGQVAHEKVLDILSKAGPVELVPGADTELERALRRATDRVAA